MAGFYGFWFGEADGSDLGNGEDAAWHHAVVDGLIFARAVFRGHDALGRGDVGQKDLAGDVSDGVDVGDFGAHLFVDGDEAAFRFDADLVKADVRGVHAAADGHQHLFRFDGRFADLACHAGISHGDVGDACSQHDFDLAFLEGPQDVFGNFWIFQGQ